MSDRIAVMNRGKVEQIGNGRSVYERSETAFVARFVGETNSFPGHVIGAADGEAEVDTKLGPMRGKNIGALTVGLKAAVFVRPEAIRWGKTDADVTFHGQIVETAYEGNLTHLNFRALNGFQVNAAVSAGDDRELPSAGETIALGFAARDAIVLATPD